MEKNNKDINITKPFEKGQKVKIDNIEKNVLEVDNDNHVLIEVQIIDNQGNFKKVKQWYNIIE